MSKFYVQTSDLGEYGKLKGNNNIYFIMFKPENSNDTEKIAQELNIPIDEYIRICKENNSCYDRNFSRYQDLFTTKEHAENALQEALEYSIDYNKNMYEYKEIKIPVYPESFTKNNNRKHIISYEEINEIIKECINCLEEDLDSEHITIQNENIAVIANRIYPCDDCDKYYYNIKVTSNYFEYDGFKDMDCELLEDDCNN